MGGRCDLIRGSYLKFYRTRPKCKYTVKSLSRWCLIIDFELGPELYHATFGRSDGDFVFNFKYFFTPCIVAVRKFHS